MGDDDQGTSGQGPKTTEVVAALRQFPTEIESDLSRFHHRDIADWWTGDLSSRRLWVFITHLTDEPDSALARTLREGDWDTELYLLMHVANELKCYRADFASAHEAKMRPTLITSPRQDADREADEQQQRDVRDVIMAQLRGEFTPPPREVAFNTEDTGTPGGGAYV